MPSPEPREVRGVKKTLNISLRELITMDSKREVFYKEALDHVESILASASIESKNSVRLDEEDEPMAEECAREVGIEDFARCFGRLQASSIVWKCSEALHYLRRAKSALLPL
eukprot:IDg14199t1